MNDRRIGWITLDEELIRKSIESGHAAAMFAGSVPIDISRDFYSRRISYLLWHPQFDQIQEGEMAPEYVATFHDDKLEPTWTRVDVRTSTVPPVRVLPKSNECG